MFKRQLINTLNIYSMSVTSFYPTLAVALSSGPQAYCHGEAEGRGPVPHDLRARLEACGFWAGLMC